MIEDIDYAARVAKGAALLDEKWPTWATDVDLETLNIAAGSDCMTAQYDAFRQKAEGVANIFGHWVDGMRRLGLNGDEYVAHGFNGVAEGGCVPQDAYDALNRLWRDLILLRRGAAQPEA